MTILTPLLRKNSPIDEEFPRKRWTREECRFLVNAGVLESGKYELIEGDIVEKVSVNEPHMFCCKRVAVLLAGVFAWDYVRIPGPVALSEISEPEPDVAVTTGRDLDYVTHGTPSSADMCLVVEVSDSTLTGDLGRKAALYSRAEIPEYWVLDINGRRLVVHRDPTETGYQSVLAYSETETVSPLAASSAVLAVADMLP